MRFYPTLLLIGCLSACATGPQVKPVDSRVERAKDANKKVEALVDDARYQKARVLAERVLADVKRELGPEHPEVAEAVTNLGAAQFYLGDLVGAIGQMELALALRRKTFGEQHEMVAESLNNLAAVHLSSGDRDKAKPLYERALEMRERLLGPDDPAVAESLVELGLIHHQAGDNEQAVPMYVRALGIWEAALGPGDRKVALGAFWLGVILERNGNLARAATMYERALAIREKVLRPDHPDLVQNLRQLAGLKTRLGAPKVAGELYERLLGLQEKTLGKDNAALIETLTSLAGMLAQTGEYAKARNTYARALELVTKLQGAGHLSAGGIRAYMADCDLALQDYAAALTGYEQAKKIVEATVGLAHPWVSYCLYGMGRVRTDQGRFEEARKLLTEAVGIAEQALGAEHPQVALALTSLGSVALLTADYAEARTLLERALAIQKKVFGAEHVQVAGIQIALGQVALRTGALGDALKLFENALATTIKAYGEEHIQAADILSYMAEITLAQRDPHKAVNLYQAAVPIYVKFLGKANTRVYAALHNFAHALAMAGQYADALEHYRYALTQYEKLLGAEHPWVAQIRCTLALIQTFAGQPDEALPVCRRGLADMEKSLGPHHYWLADNLRCLTQAGLRRGDDDVARQAAAKALSIASRNVDALLGATSDRERAQLLESRRVHVDAYLSLHDRPSDARDAYAAVLQWKGAGMISLAAQHESALASRDPRTRDVLRELNLVRRELAEFLFRTPQPGPEAEGEWGKRVVTLTEQKDALERELAGRSAGIRRSTALLDASVDAVCRGLKKDEVLLDFLLYGRMHRPEANEPAEVTWTGNYLVYVLQSGACDRPERIELGAAKRINQNVTRYRRLLREQAPFPMVRREAQRLWQLVWEPVMERVRGRRKVWIVPDSMLAGLPFGVLMDDEEKFLVERLTIAYLSTAQELARRRRAAQLGTGGVLVAGGIDYGKPEGASSPSSGQRAPRAADAILPVSDLPETLVEAELLTGFLSKRRRRNVILLKGRDATEERVKRELEGKRIVHLATHGFFGRKQQVEVVHVTDVGTAVIEAKRTGILLTWSGLVLAGANEQTGQAGGEDGLLSAEEVSSMDLRGTGMVTLSACETGYGTPTEGEGVLGLRRAFFVAGARAVVMSLWMVPDEPTRELMASFYRRVLAGRRKDPSEALRQAKLELIRRLRRDEGEAHPLIWGAFIVSGR